VWSSNGKWSFVQTQTCVSFFNLTRTDCFIRLRARASSKSRADHIKSSLDEVVAGDIGTTWRTAQNLLHNNHKAVYSDHGAIIIAPWQRRCMRTLFPRSADFSLLHRITVINYNWIKITILNNPCLVVTSVKDQDHIDPTFTFVLRLIDSNNTSIKRVVYSEISWKQQFTRRTSWSSLSLFLGNSVWWWIHWRSSKSCLLYARIWVWSICLHFVIWTRNCIRK